ncbi:hypothetical protein K439DRAFT_1639109 [Ramaria rubella]|nr:hypothetical protein K439DRAFT_1639109 [Ramaria rubella]
MACLQCPSCLISRPIDAFKQTLPITSTAASGSQVTPPDTPMLGRTLQPIDVGNNAPPPTFALPNSSANKGKANEKPTSDGATNPFNDTAPPAPALAPPSIYSSSHAHASSSSSAGTSHLPSAPEGAAAPSTASHTSNRQPPTVLVPKAVMPYVRQPRPPTAIGTDYLVMFLWSLRQVGACAWCYITLRGEMAQHEHGICTDDSVIFTRYQEFKKSSTSEICRAVKGSQAVICARCWMPWPREKHGDFSRKEACIFDELLTWLAFAILSDSDAQDTYRLVFDLAERMFDVNEILADSFELRGGEMGIWNAVTGVVKAIELQKRHGKDTASG